MWERNYSCDDGMESADRGGFEWCYHDEVTRIMTAEHRRAGIACAAILVAASSISAGAVVVENTTHAQQRDQQHCYDQDAKQDCRGFSFH